MSRRLEVLTEIILNLFCYNGNYLRDAVVTWQIKWKGCMYNFTTQKWCRIIKISQNFMKAFSVDGVRLKPQLMAPYRKINIASEKIINYRVTYLSNHCCQISITVRERPGISVIIHFFLFLK